MLCPILLRWNKMRRNPRHTFSIFSRIGYARECANCGREIRARYTHCYLCNKARKRAGWHDPENLPDLEQQDSHRARTFQVYVLHTDYGHYVGHTGNIQARMRAHLAGKVPSTAGANPRKVWQSSPLKTRRRATHYEAALKSWRDNRNERFKQDTGIYPIPYQVPETGNEWMLIALGICLLILIVTFFFALPKIMLTILGR